MKVVKVLLLSFAFALFGCGSGDENKIGADDIDSGINNPGQFNPPSQASTYANNPNLSLEQIRTGVAQLQFRAQAQQIEIYEYFVDDNQFYCFLSAAINCDTNASHNWVYSLDINQNQLYEGTVLTSFNPGSFNYGIHNVNQATVINILSNIVNNGTVLTSGPFGQGNPMSISFPNGRFAYRFYLSGKYYDISFDYPLFANPVGVFDEDNGFLAEPERVMTRQVFIPAF